MNTEGRVWRVIQSLCPRPLRTSLWAGVLLGVLQPLAKLCMRARWGAPYLGGVCACPSPSLRCVVLVKHWAQEYHAGGWLKSFRSSASPTSRPEHISPPHCSPVIRGESIARRTPFPGPRAVCPGAGLQEWRPSGENERRRRRGWNVLGEVLTRFP